MKITRILRLTALVIMIAMASVLPVPLIFYKKDKNPKYLLEQIDEKEDEDYSDVKVLF